MSSHATEPSSRRFLPDDRRPRQGTRRRERQAAVPGRGADREYVIELLNTALASELISALRCERHHDLATAIHAGPVAATFLEHATDERAHADRFCVRIRQLGGAPDLNPSGLPSRDHPGYVPGESLPGMIRESLICERIAIESYGEMIRNVGPDDATTSRILAAILEQEEKHAADMTGLLACLAPKEPG